MANLVTDALPILSKMKVHELNDGDSFHFKLGITYLFISNNNNNYRSMTFGTSSGAYRFQGGLITIISDYDNNYPDYPYIISLGAFTNFRPNNPVYISKPVGYMNRTGGYMIEFLGGANGAT